MIVGLDPFPPDEPVNEFYRNGRLIDLDRTARVRSVTLDWPRRLDIAFDITQEYVSPEFMLVADGVVFSFRGLTRVEMREKEPDHEDLRGRLFNFSHGAGGEELTIFDIDIAEVEIVVVARDLRVDVVGDRDPGGPRSPSAP